MNIKFNSLEFVEYIAKLNGINVGLSNQHKVEIKKVHLCDSEGTSHYFDNIRIIHADIEIED